MISDRNRKYATTKFAVNCHPKWRQTQAQIVTNRSKTQPDNPLLSQKLITKSGSDHSGMLLPNQNDHCRLFK